jgi:hypothetical protein
MGLLTNNAPGRLLRKPWQTAQELAEELYAMFRAPGPVDHKGTVKIQAPANTTALKVERVGVNNDFNFSPGGGVNKGDTIQSSPSTTTRPRVTTDDQGRPRSPMALDPSPSYPVLPTLDPSGHRSKIALDSSGLRATPELPDRFSAPYEAPTVDLGGSVRFRGDEPVHFDRPPYVWNEDKFHYEPLTLSLEPLDEPGDGSGGTTVFLGQVVSGSGDTYSVNLFGSGTAQASTATVTVTIPQIATTETIPATTWLQAVYQFTDSSGNVTYEAQVPVWLDTLIGGS